MRFVEGNCRSVSPPPSADICCAPELNRSNSVASTLTAENCEDILHRSANLKPGYSTMWTDEKHSLYLEHLEVSFVKQLHQSIGVLVQCSDVNKKDKILTKMHVNNVHNAAEQVEVTTEAHGCWEKIKNNMGDRLSHVSHDPLSPIKGPRVYRSKRIGVHCPAASANMPELNTLCNMESLGKEGTGQNFVDEGGDQTKSNTEPRVKRLKTAKPD